MRVFLLSIFLTFVLSGQFAKAAPQTNTTIQTKPFVDEVDPHLQGIQPGLRESLPTMYLGLGLGYFGGHYLEQDRYSQGLTASLRYIPFDSGELPIFDYQLQISEAKFVGIGMGYRLYCCPEDPYLPYLRLGGQLYLDGNSELAGLVAIRRWRAHAAVGIGESINTEIGLGLAVTGVDLYALFSYHWPF